MQLKPPIIQVALDFASFEEAEQVARLAIDAGVDWLEIGTPLIVSQGLRPIAQMVQAFPGRVVLADYKTMDSGGKNVHLTGKAGAQVMTVCGGAPDETIQSAVAASTETGVWVVVDLIGVRDRVARARQCETWGVNMLYLHYGADQRRNDPSRDSVSWIAELQAAVNLPIGVACFGADDAVRAVEQGAELVAIGHPVISGDDPAGELADFVQQVRAAYRPRKER